MKFLLVGEMKV